MTFTNPILSGTKLVREAMESENYETGVSGWRITRDGDAEFNDLTARGDITASSVDVTNPNDDTNHATLKPDDPSDLGGGNGTPTLRIFHFGVERIVIGTGGGTANGELLAQSGAGATELLGLPSDEFYAMFRARSSGSSIRLGQYDTSTDYLSLLNDMLRIFHDGARARIEHLNGTQELELNPDGGKVTVNGIIAPRYTGNLLRDTGGPAPFTAETIVDTISATVVSGREYRIEWDGFMRSTVAGDRVRIRVRDTDLAGAIYGEILPFIANSGVFVPQRLEGHMLASASGAKNFVVTMERFSGTGSITAPANATQRVFGYVTEFK